MNIRITDLKQKGIEILSNLSCDFAEIRISSGSGTTISLSGSETDSISSGISLAGSVRVLVDGAWGFASFNNIGDLEKFSQKAVRSASLSRPEEKSSIKKTGRVTGDFSSSFKKDFRTISPEEKFSLLSSYNKILRSSEKIQTTRAVYTDAFSEYLYINTEGSDLSYERMYCGISLSAIARNGNIIQPFHDSTSGYCGYEIALGREEMAEKIVKTAIDLLDADSPDGGTYSIITDPKLSGVFIHEALGHLSEADFVHENENMRKQMQIGKRFGKDILNVIDDGSIKELPGYIPFDDEGVLSGKSYLIKDGILSGRLHSRETAEKMNEPLTGNGRAIGVMSQPIVRMTNTYIDNAESTPGEIFDSVKDGIYAVNVIGGQTNLEMFTFTSAYGYKIKNGKKGKMFKDIVLSGNLFSTLMNIEKIGNDKTMFGGLGGCGKGGQSPLPVSFGGPHMLIQNVLVGGKQ